MDKAWSPIIPICFCVVHPNSLTWTLIIVLLTCILRRRWREQWPWWHGNIFLDTSSQRILVICVISIDLIVVIVFFCRLSFNCLWCPVPTFPDCYSSSLSCLLIIIHCWLIFCVYYVSESPRSMFLALSVGWCFLICPLSFPNGFVLWSVSENHLVDVSQWIWPLACKQINPRAVSSYS